MVDPNPRVSGRGVRQLRRAGIEVRVGVLQAECRRTNEAFRKHIIRGVPFVLLKLAASLDGKIATSTGDSRWITETASRRYVHGLRARVDAVLVGVGTVLADDPRLTCRLAKGRDPWRIILDRRLRIPLTAGLFRQREPEKTIVVTGSRAPIKKVRAIEATGAQVWSFPLRKGTVPFVSVLKRLGRLGLMSVMIEGGGITASRAVREGVVDKILFFYGPKIVGGDGREMIGALGIKKMSRATKLKEMEVKRIGKDFLVSGYPT
jgi:diaminohydroxyphosphoribosylaminopyrimidine deaminase/5-amino-6-(5-phosphoribosylamino)uracil reductase